TTTGKLLCQLKAEPRINFGAAIAFSPDSRRVATSGPKGTVCLWDPANGKKVRQFDPDINGNVVSLSFTRDRRILRAVSLTFRDPGTVTAWDIESGKELYQRKAPFDPYQNNVFFSPDDRFLIWQRSDSKLWVQELTSSKEAQRWLEHPE